MASSVLSRLFAKFVRWTVLGVAEGMCQDRFALHELAFFCERWGSHDGDHKAFVLGRDRQGFVHWRSR